MCVPPVAGCVHLQRRSDGPAQTEQLRVPEVGARRGLVHGPVIHGSDPGIHGLHVPHPEGLI